VSLLQGGHCKTGGGSVVVVCNCKDAADCSDADEDSFVDSDSSNAAAMSHCRCSLRWSPDRRFHKKIPRCNMSVTDFCMS